LFFKPELETNFAGTAVSTPFDSGGVFTHLRPSDRREDQIAFVRQHEMPVPEYRDYFQRSLTILFASPWNYIDGTGPDFAGPISTDGGDARRWTFEVRFRKELSLTGVLRGVILPVALAVTLTSEIAVWRRAGVDVRYYLVPDPSQATEWQLLYNASVQSLREWLQ
jgi:hypothetical protein